MASNDKPNEWENPEPSALATFLETNDSFKLAVLELRDRPFLDPDETAEAKAPQLLSREEAGKPKLGQRRLANWLRVVLFGLAALCIVGMLVVALEELRIGRANGPADARKSFASEPVIALLTDLLEEVFPGVFQKPPPAPGTPEKTTVPPPLPAHGLNLAYLGLFSILAACLLVDILCYELPDHTPDPLFGRLLQAQFNESKPLTARFIVKLLGDKRFALVLQGAASLVLIPIGDATVELVESAVEAQDYLRKKCSQLANAKRRLKRAKKRTWGFVKRAEAAQKEAESNWNSAKGTAQKAIRALVDDPKCVAKWRVFIKRLQEELLGDETFIQLRQSRTVLYDGQETIVDSDHAIESYLLYAIRTKLFETVVKDPDLAYIYQDRSDWVSSLGRLINKVDVAKLKGIIARSREKAAAHGSDAQGLAYATLVVLLLIALALLTNRAPSAKPADNEQLSLLAKETERIRTSLEAFLARPQQPIEVQCPQPPVVIVTSPAAAPQTVSVAPPIINFPSKPPDENQLPTISFPSTFTVDENASPATPQADGPLKPGCCSESSRDLPKAGDPAKAVDDTIVRLSTSKKWLDDQFVVKSGDGERCAFSAQLLWRDPRPPHPIAAKVSSLPQNPLPCAALDGATVFAGQKPIYDTSLHAYISVEEMHRSLRWSSDLGREFIVLRIHPQGAP